MEHPSIHVLLFRINPQMTTVLTNWLAANYIVETAIDPSDLLAQLAGNFTPWVLCEATFPLEEIAALTTRVSKEYPETAVIWLTNQITPDLYHQAFRSGVCDILVSPFTCEELLSTLSPILDSISRARRGFKQVYDQMVRGMETTPDIDQQETALLDFENLMPMIVDAAVKLTKAEAGILWVLDQTSGELYRGASRNVDHEFEQTIDELIQDFPPGEVLLSGKPVLVNGQNPPDPLAESTTCLPYSLIYAPLRSRRTTVGTLGVINRSPNRPFTHLQLDQVTILADIAAIAIANQRNYAAADAQSTVFETLISNIPDGILVVDGRNRIVIINPAAQHALDLPSQPLTGCTLQEAIHNEDLVKMLDSVTTTPPYQGEISVNGKRVFNAQATPIPGIGQAITLQDITRLKELDQVKSDMVHTVSHDLRSPLTAILGYVELIERVGPVNQLQKTFIARIQSSASNITALINDLLDLEQIEAGYQVGKEIVSLEPLLQSLVGSFISIVEAKQLTLKLELEPGLPNLLGNAVRLQQLFSNLVDNALKYTPPGGYVKISAHSQVGQLIIRVVDNGVGIPSSEHALVFNKFYRATNVPKDVPGTGLGLAIVKSIVEHHQGRIWLDSIPGKGSTFSVLLPVSQ